MTHQFIMLDLIMKCYTYTDIPQEYSELWAGDFPLNPDLHLPAENKFIGQFPLHSLEVHSFLHNSFHLSSSPSTASDFTLKTSDCPDTDFPVKIIDNERGRLWFRKDNKFKIPKGTLITRETQWDKPNVISVIMSVFSDSLCTLPAAHSNHTGIS